MSTLHSETATFFFSDDCPLCPGVLDKILKVFADEKLPLRVRKPSVMEAKIEGFGYPALFIPATMLELGKPHLLVGKNLAEGLRSLRELKGKLS